VLEVAYLPAFLDAKHGPNSLGGFQRAGHAVTVQNPTKCGKAGRHMVELVEEEVVGVDASMFSGRSTSMG
jgi:hypothetical protein